MLVGRLLDKDNDDDTDHGKLVTTFLNTATITSLPFPSLPFPKHCHFPFTTPSLHSTNTSSTEP
jgi:hypothetical protein